MVPGRFIDCNRAFLAVTGFTKAELRSHGCGDEDRLTGTRFVLKPSY